MAVLKLKFFSSKLNSYLMFPTIYFNLLFGSFTSNLQISDVFLSVFPESSSSTAISSVSTGQIL